MSTPVPTAGEVSSRAAPSRVLALACAVTLLHLTGARMIVPVLPLYAIAHGASTTGVGLIVGAHMLVAALTAIPFGRASDTWGRRPFLLGGMVLSLLTAVALPVLTHSSALLVVYGVAGLGLAAFTPSLMSLIGDHRPHGRWDAPMRGTRRRCTPPLA